MKKSVSIRGDTHAKIKEHCDKHGLSLTQFVDELCTAFLAKHGRNGAKPRKKQP